MADFNIKKYLLENKLYKPLKKEDVNWDDLDQDLLSQKNKTNTIEYAALLKHTHDGYLDGKYRLGKGTSARFLIDRILRNYLGSAKPAFRVSKRMSYVLKKLGLGDWTNYYMTAKEYGEVKNAIKKYYPKYLRDVLNTNSIVMQNLFRLEHLFGIEDIIKILIDKKDKFKDANEALEFMKKNTLIVFTFYPIEKDHINGKVHDFNEFLKYDSTYKQDIKKINDIMLFNKPEYKDTFNDQDYYSDVK